MASNSSMSLTSLDVLSIESSLREFMAGQDAFKDYDFQGSNLSALIRLMSYNAWRQNFYLNMVNAEGFLDSAQTRGSVLSHAKELNYVPRSARSASATVTVSFTGSNSSYVLAKGQTFSSIVDNRGLVFSLPKTSLLTSSNGSFELTTEVYEGRYVADSYVMDASDATQRFFLQTPSADTDSMTVLVYENGSVSGSPYTLAASMLGVTGSANVYFLQASETGRYEVIFGDGVVGNRPADGSTIVIDYRSTSGSAGNGARVFTHDFNLGSGVTNVRVSTVSASSSGLDEESLESIRYYAPRHYQVQERAVVGSDYAIMLKTQFPEIRAVSAYGGEEANPPQYGKVIVAVDVQDVDGIPDSKRDEYYSFLRSRSAMTPVFVEPKYTYLAIDTTVFYNLNVTVLPPDNIRSVVLDAILSYGDEYLNGFGKRIRFSKLTTLIDDSHSSIVGNQTTLTIYKKVEVSKGRTQSFSLSFDVPIFDGYPEVVSTFPSTDVRAIYTDPFTVSSESRFLTDDGSGNVWTATNRGTTTLLLQRVGTIDYGTGAMQVSNLYVDGFTGVTLNFYARTQTSDVTTGGDTILALEPSAVSVTATAVRE